MKRGLPYLMALACLFSLPAMAQDRKPARTPAKKVKKISDTFAKAALLALNKISTDPTESSVEGGSIMGNKDTVNSISNADVEAVSEAERMVARQLTVLYSRQLVANKELAVATLVHESDDDLWKLPPDIGRVLASQRAAKRPEIVAAREKVHICVAALDTSLRARSTEIPKVCESK